MISIISITINTFKGYLSNHISSLDRKLLISYLRITIRGTLIFHFRDPGRFACCPKPQFFQLNSTNNVLT